MEQKQSSPYLTLDKGGAVDFLFELMMPKERQEVIEDFLKGVRVKLPSKRDLKDIDKPLSQPSSVKKDEVRNVEDPHTLDFLKLWSRGKGESSNPLLEYDERRHMYVKRADNFFKNYMKLYVDMDGVLTDFDAAATAIGGAAGLAQDASQEDKQAMYDKIEAAGPSYWSSMPWKEDGKELWKVCSKFGARLLSSPGKFLHAERGKQDWVKRELPGTPLFLDEDKYRWAERDAVLIDDNVDNVHGWIQAGGIGILHKNARDTEIKLLSLLAPPDGC